MTRVLVLGAYGLIGSAIVSRLRAESVDIVGLGRSAELGRRLIPDIAWRGADIARLTTAEAWAPLLEGVDVVVNAAGALQDGARDDLEALHHLAIAALIQACEANGVSRFVQISAPGADEAAATAFLQTKGAGDAALRASALDWVILKPGLVIAPGAYGGTLLLRTLAAFPWVQPIVLGDAVIQTVAMSDVADAVARAFAGAAPMRRDYDLVAMAPHTLREVVLKFRSWLGFVPPRVVLTLPTGLGFSFANGADMLGWLGWRSPLRTTALLMLKQGVRGDAEPWRQVTGAPLKNLDETLAAIPSTMQERVFARVQLVFPLLALTLGAFWIASGAVALAHVGDAARVLGPTLGASGARFFVQSTALLDIVIGAGVFVRDWTRRAAWTAIVVSFVYLVGAGALAPQLWADPLGPLVKIFPGMALALAVAAMAERR